MYMSWFSLCWRCTWSGMSGDRDVILLRWASWVQYLFITGAGSTRWRLWVAVLAPQYSQYLRAVNALVYMQLSNWARKQLLALTV